MKRLFWLGVGVGIGVFAVRRLNRAVETYGPKGLQRGVTEFGESIRTFADDVRSAMSRREDELMTALGVDADARNTQVVRPAIPGVPAPGAASAATAATFAAAPPAGRHGR